MPTKVDELIQEEFNHIVAELKQAGFTPAQINALYHSMHRVITIVSIKEADHRIFEGDNGVY